MQIVRAAANSALDIRGSWDMVAVADGTQHPQTMHFFGSWSNRGRILEHAVKQTAVDAQLALPISTPT